MRFTVRLSLALHLALCVGAVVLFVTAYSYGWVVFGAYAYGIAVGVLAEREGNGK